MYFMSPLNPQQIDSAVKREQSMHQCQQKTSRATSYRVVELRYSRVDHVIALAPVNFRAPRLKMVPE